MWCDVGHSLKLKLKAFMGGGGGGGGLDISFFPF